MGMIYLISMILKGIGHPTTETSFIIGGKHYFYLDDTKSKIRFVFYEGLLWHITNLLDIQEGED